MIALGVVYWVLAIVMFVFHLYNHRADWRTSIPSFGIYVLLFILGWVVFGKPISD